MCYISRIKELDVKYWSADNDPNSIFLGPFYVWSHLFLYFLVNWRICALSETWKTELITVFFWVNIFWVKAFTVQFVLGKPAYLILPGFSKWKRSRHELTVGLTHSRSNHQISDYHESLVTRRGESFCVRPCYCFRSGALSWDDGTHM